MFEQLMTDISELSNAEIDQRLRDLEVQLRALQAEQAVLVRFAEHRQVPADHDHRSVNAYLRATLNCSSSEASRLRSVARAVDAVDGLGDTWAAGHVGRCQVDRFARLHGNRRVRDHLPDVVPLLLDDAEHLSYREFDLCVERFVAHADQDGAHDARDDAIEHRDAHVVELAGVLDVSANGGDPTTAAEVVAIFDQFCNAEYRADLASRRAEFGDRAELHPLPRTAGQRRFDAFIALARAAGASTATGKPCEPLVSLVVDAATFAELLHERGLLTDDGLLAELAGRGIPLRDRRCHTAAGTPVHPHDVLRAALEGHVRRVVVDSASRVIDLGRSQRLFTGAARDAAMLLVTHCEHPGCDLPADWCDVDHSVEWADGGRTDQANAGIECGRHNTAKTRRRWRTRRATDGRHFTIRADGTILLPAGARPPTFPDESDDDPADDPAHDPAHDPAEVIRLTRTARSRVAKLRRSG